MALNYYHDLRRVAKAGIFIGAILLLSPFKDALKAFVDYPIGGMSFLTLSSAVGVLLIWVLFEMRNNRI